MKDWQTNDEFQAGISAQLDAYRDDDRDYDLGPSAEPAHDPATCADRDCRDLPCVLHRVVEEQKAEQRAWDEYKRSQRDEEAS